VHGDNDIVSIGSAPNVAAKLSDKRDWYETHISDAVYDLLNDSSKYSSGVDMWTRLGSEMIGGRRVYQYGSAYSWEP
jgi:class 3 adenylate cyclase